MEANAPILCLAEANANSAETNANSVEPNAIIGEDESVLNYSYD